MILASLWPSPANYLFLLGTQLTVQILLTHLREIVFDFRDMLLGGVIEAGSRHFLERYLGIVVNALDAATIASADAGLTSKCGKIDTIRIR